MILENVSDTTLGDISTQEIYRNNLMYIGIAVYHLNI